MTLVPDATGKVIQKPSSYVQFQTGMHYLENGQWLESKEVIEIIGNSAVARQGQHKVIFGPNINTAGAIDLLSPDGKRFRSHVLGLSYFDATTGKRVFIAEIKDSIGELHPPNQIIYRDAFNGIKADVRYTYTKEGRI